MCSKAGADLARVRPRLRAHRDRKSTRLNSSHTEIYTLSLHDALPICCDLLTDTGSIGERHHDVLEGGGGSRKDAPPPSSTSRSEEHTSELQSHRDLHSFPTRRSSDLLRSPDRHGLDR